MELFDLVHFLSINSLAGVFVCVVFSHLLSLPIPSLLLALAVSIEADLFRASLASSAKGRADQTAAIAGRGSARVREGRIGVYTVE